MNPEQVKNAPATPLPWVYLRDPDNWHNWWIGTAPTQQGKTLRDLIAQVADDRNEPDAAYIVHACNNYGRLVAALRAAARELDSLYAHAINTGIAEAGNPPHLQALQVLRELGESDA